MIGVNMTFANKCLRCPRHRLDPYIVAHQRMAGEKPHFPQPDPSIHLRLSLGPPRRANLPRSQSVAHCGVRRQSTDVSYSASNEYFDVMNRGDPQHWISNEKARKLIQEKLVTKGLGNDLSLLISDHTCFFNDKGQKAMRSPEYATYPLQKRVSIDSCASHCHFRSTQNVFCSLWINANISHHHGSFPPSPTITGVS